MLKCSQGLLCTQGCSGQCPFWFLLLNLTSAFYLLLCIFVSALSSEPHPLFKGSLLFSVNFLKFSVYSPIKMLRRRISERGRHSSTFSALLPPGWLLDGYWANITFHHISVIKVNNIKKLPLNSRRKQTNDSPKPQLYRDFHMLWCIIMQILLHFFQSQHTWLFWVTVSDLTKNCGDHNPLKRSLWNYFLEATVYHFVPAVCCPKQLLALLMYGVSHVFKPVVMSLCVVCCFFFPSGWTKPHQDIYIH